MYGTVARIRVKPENRKTLQEVLRGQSYQTVPGFQTSYILWEGDSDAAWLVAVSRTGPHTRRTRTIRSSTIGISSTGHSSRRSRNGTMAKSNKPERLPDQMTPRYRRCRVEQDEQDVRRPRRRSERLDRGEHRFRIARVARRVAGEAAIRNREVHALQVVRHPRSTFHFPRVSFGLPTKAAAMLAHAARGRPMRWEVT